MMPEDKKNAPIKIGMLGLSIDEIDSGKWGYVMLPIGGRDATMAGGREWVRVKVRAMENVRAERDIIVGNLQGEVKEHTPVELAYGLDAGGYQTVGQSYPLPVREGLINPKIKWNTRAAAGNILTITPASGKYVSLLGLEVSVDTADEIRLEVLTTTNSWASQFSWYLANNTTVNLRLPHMKIKELYVGDTSGTAAKGDGSTFTIRVRLVNGAGKASATVVWEEVD